MLFFSFSYINSYWPYNALPRLHSLTIETFPTEDSTPCNGLYGVAPPEKGTFFRLRVYKRVAISLVEVCKRVNRLLSVKKSQKGKQINFIAAKKFEKHELVSIFKREYI